MTGDDLKRQVEEAQKRLQAWSSKDEELASLRNAVAEAKEPS